jgi:hypothetical protein
VQGSYPHVDIPPQTPPWLLLLTFLWTTIRTGHHVQVYGYGEGGKGTGLWKYHDQAALKLLQRTREHSIQIDSSSSSIKNFVFAGIISLG